MHTRRSFVQTAAAVTALVTLPLGARVTVAAPSRESGARSLFKVIFDRSFAEGAAFGAEAARLGAAVHGIASDLGGFWMNVLEPALRVRPVVIAGLTSAPSLFCLELLARGHGLRTVYRVEHARSSGGAFAHAVTGNPALAPWPARLASTADWPRCAAELATSYPPALVPESSIALLDLAERPGRAADSLYSWRLAPAPLVQ
jgi:hypothetical protein